MRNYKLYDRQENINGIGPEQILNNQPFKNYDGDIILIYAKNSNRVTNIECKDILASVYNININLPLDEFMSEYFSKINQNEEEVTDEPIA